MSTIVFKSQEILVNACKVVLEQYGEKPYFVKFWRVLVHNENSPYCQIANKNLRNKPSIKSLEKLV